MSIQKQQDSTFVDEQETPSGNPQWHAPVLNVYNAEDAETHVTGTHLDASSALS
jgi:hypothetical protein